MKNIILIIFLCGALSGNAQSKPGQKDITISFLFPQKVKDSADVNCRIIFRNKASQTDSIYKYFETGALDDELSNIHINVERLINGKYSDYPRNYYQTFTDNTIRPADKCLDLPKKTIAPQMTDTAVFNLLNVAGVFEKGKYRFKAFIRTGCTISGGNVPENPRHANKTFFESKWIYFEVTKPISKKPKPIQ